MYKHLRLLFPVKISKTVHNIHTYVQLIIKNLLFEQIFTYR